MIARRQVLESALLANLMPSAAGAAPQVIVPERALEDVARSLRDIHDVLDPQQTYKDIAPVRQRLIDFLRAQMKFPDYMDLGTDPWFAAYDWHVRHLQPLVVGRDANGRYTLQFVQTTLVLRPDMMPNFIGPPYDNR